MYIQRITFYNRFSGYLVSLKLRVGDYLKLILYDYLALDYDIYKSLTDPLL
jgi:hypothetical protein